MPFFYLLGKPPVATIVFSISAISLFTTAGPLLGDFVNPWTFAIFEALHCFVYLLFCEGNGHGFWQYRFEFAYFCIFEHLLLELTDYFYLVVHLYLLSGHILLD